MQVRNEVKELRLLFEVLQILDSASDLSDNLETVLEVMAEHTGMMRGVITLLDEAHGEIAIEAAYGMSAEAQSKGRYKLGEGITGKVIESGKPLVIPNVLVEPLFLNRTGSRSRKEAVSFICVPVKMEGRVIGALSADRLFAASEALEEDMRLLSVLASLISKAVKNRQERHRMLEENRRLLDVLRERSRPEMFVGRSPGLRAVLTQLAQVAPTSATVLLLGESGTGKELAANTIHAGSPRAGHPFIKINCAALPEGLIESELFGHEKGAFTGAVGMRKGRFEAADGGTLTKYRREHAEATFSFTACGFNRQGKDGPISGDDEALELADRAQGFFLFAGRQLLADLGVVVVRVENTQSRSAFDTNETDRRYGFDVLFRYEREDKRAVPAISKPPITFTKEE